MSVYQNGGYVEALIVIRNNLIIKCLLIFIFTLQIIKTVGSINIGTNEISWAKINCISKNLDVWDSIDLDSILLSKKIDLLNLISFVSRFLYYYIMIIETH